MILEVILLSFIIALIRKGKFKNIISYNIKFKIVFLLYLIVHAGLVFFGYLLPAQIADYSMLIYLLSYLLLLAFLARNIGKYEYIIILIGVFLNFAVTFLNGGKMPLSLDAAVITGLADSGNVFLSKMHLISYAMDSSTKLSILGDIIPMPSAYPFRIVLSAGDIIISLGAFIAVQRMFVRKNSSIRLSQKKEVEREEIYFSNNIPLVDINEFFNKDPNELKTFSQAENNAIMGLVDENEPSERPADTYTENNKKDTQQLSRNEKQDAVNYEQNVKENKPFILENAPDTFNDDIQLDNSISNIKFNDNASVEQGQITFLDPEMSKYVDMYDANEPVVIENKSEDKEEKPVIKQYPDIGEELRKQREIDKQARLAAQQREVDEINAQLAAIDEIEISDLAKSQDEEDEEEYEKTRQLETRPSAAKSGLKSLKDGESFEYNKDKFTITVKDDDIPIGERKETFLKRLYEYDIDIRKTQAATTEEKEKIELEVKRDKGINVDDKFIIQDGKIIENPNYKLKKKK
ncbi:MAG: DUF5317 domain-containing protein [Eubacteriaceae bacterium]